MQNKEMHAKEEGKRWQKAKSLLSIWLSCNLKWWKVTYFIVAEE